MQLVANFSIVRQRISLVQTGEAVGDGDVVTISEVCEDEPTLVVEGSGEGEED